MLRLMRCAERVGSYALLLAVLALPACGGAGAQGPSASPIIAASADARLDVYAATLSNGSHEIFIEPTSVVVNGSNVSVSYGAAPIALTNVVSVKHTKSVAQTVAQAPARDVAGSTGCVGGEEFNWSGTATNYTATYLASQNSTSFGLTYTIPATDYKLNVTQAFDWTADYFPTSGGEEAESIPFSEIGVDSTDGPITDGYIAWVIPGEFGVDFQYDDVAVSINATTPSGGSTDWTAEGNQRGCRLTT